MTRKYQKPELVDLKNSTAAGNCAGGSAVAPGEQCTSGASALGCISGAIAGESGCVSGSNATTLCTTGGSPQA